MISGQIYQPILLRTVFQVAKEKTNKQWRLPGVPAKINFDVKVSKIFKKVSDKLIMQRVLNRDQKSHTFYNDLFAIASRFMYHNPS